MHQYDHGSGLVSGFPAARWHPPAPEGPRLPPPLPPGAPQQRATPKGLATPVRELQGWSRLQAAKQRSRGLRGGGRRRQVRHVRSHSPAPFKLARGARRSIADAQPLTIVPLWGRCRVFYLLYAAEGHFGRLGSPLPLPGGAPGAVVVFDALLGAGRRCGPVGAMIPPLPQHRRPTPSPLVHCCQPPLQPQTSSQASTRLFSAERNGREAKGVLCCRSTASTRWQAALARLRAAWLSAMSRVHDSQSQAERPSQA